jgi:hypothetical protein
LFGKKLGGQNNLFQADQANITFELEHVIQEEGLPFFGSVSCLESVLAFLKPKVFREDGGYVNPHAQEAFAYTLIRSGDYLMGMDALKRFEALLSPTNRMDDAFRLRAQLIREKMSMGPDSAQLQLDAWRAETLQHLKLEDYAKKVHRTGQ